MLLQWVTAQSLVLLQGLHRQSRTLERAGQPGGRFRASGAWSSCRTVSRQSSEPLFHAPSSYAWWERHGLFSMVQISRARLTTRSVSSSCSVSRRCRAAAGSLQASRGRPWVSRRLAAVRGKIRSAPATSRSTRRSTCRDTSVTGHTAQQPASRKRPTMRPPADPPAETHLTQVTQPNSQPAATQKNNVWVHNTSN